MKNGPSRSEQRTGKTRNNHLTGKSPIQVRIHLPPARSLVRTRLPRSGGPLGLAPQAGRQWAAFSIVVTLRSVCFAACASQRVMCGRRSRCHVSSTRRAQRSVSVRRPASFSNCTASSMSRPGRALAPRAAYFEPLGRSTTRMCGSGCRLRGRYSAASSGRRNRSRLMPGAGSPSDVIDLVG